MSPEQARGKSVDRRTDVWAFGCVLFEMLTGRVAFAGDTLSDTIAALLEREPEWSGLPASTPAPIRRLLLRSLEKDAKRRLRDIGDVRTDIDDVLSGAATLAPAPMVIAPASAPDARVAALVRRHRGALELAALIVALAVAGAWYLATRDGGTASLLSYDDIVQLTTTGNATLSAISPDGRYIAYVQPDDNGDSLWILDTTAASSPLQIVRPRAGVRIKGATFTPDGTSVDFLEPTPTTTALWRVPFLGTKPPKHVIDGVQSPVAWSADGRWMAFIRIGVRQENGMPRFDFNSTQLIRADFDGGNQRVLATQKSPDPRFFTVWDPGALPARPAWSPNGEVIAMGGIGFPDGKPTGYTIFVTVANGTVRVVPQTPPGTGAWINDSWLVWNRGNCQGAPGQLSWLSYRTGELSKLTNDVSNYSGVSMTADRDSLATARTDIRVDIWVGDGRAINGDDVVSGAAMPLFASGSSVTWVGDRLLFTVRSGGCLALSAFYPEQNKTEDIIPKADSPAGTSDGRTTVYVSRADDKLNSLWAEDAGGRNPRQLAVDGSWPVVTPDDQRVFYVSGNRPWSVSIDGGKPDLIADVDARIPDVSPDGTSLAFLTPDNQIVVCKLADCSSPSRRYKPEGLTASLQTGGRIRWTPDRRGIAYVRVDRVEPQPNIWIQPLDGSPRPLTRFTDGRLILDFAWSRDGARLAITRARVTTDIVLLKGLRPPR